MTHASWNNEQGRPSGPGHDNERLEYLGDAVLELVVGEYLFRRFPDYDEGQLTQLRAALVNTLTLARLAERLHLGEALFVGKGAAKTGARQLPSLLANSFESMIGAIFLDQGYRVATRVFLQNIGDLAEWSDANYKGKLQEVAQDRTGTTPSYRVSATGGPGHKREYTAEAVVGGEVVGTGRGTTKQAAEQAAARSALQTLGKQPKRRAPARSATTRAAGAARAAATVTAGEPPRVRRRVAEVAADRSVSSRHLERAQRDAAPPLLEVASPASDEPRRRRGLLGAIRSAAEALVGRGAAPEAVAEAPPPPIPAPEARPPRSPGARRRGSSAGRDTAGRAQAPRANPPAGTDRPRSSAAPGEPRTEAPARTGTPRRRRPTPAAGSTAETPTTPGADAPQEGAESRRPSRRGRRGGRGRRRPGTPGTDSPTP
jgi:ribonuclease-3